MSTAEAVVIVGAGLLQCPLIDEAHALGFTVIVTDRDPHAPGVRKAETFYCIDTYDAQRTATLVDDLIVAGCPIRGICTAGSDTAPTCALAAERAGLPGIPFVVAERTHNKLAVRRALAEAGLQDYQPRWQDIPATAGVPWLQSVVERDMGYPCILKPLHQRASRGVRIVRQPEALAMAYATARTYGDTCLLVEQCLTGTEHSCEVLFDAQGQAIWANIVDRPFDYSAGVPIELGHINPTGLCADSQEYIYTMVFEVAHALGVHFGPFKVDVLFSNHRPYVLECTARLSGGFDCQKTSPLTGRHPMRQLLQLACGRPVEPQGVAQGFAACAAILPQKSGVLRAWPEWRNASHACHTACLTLEEAILVARPGDAIHPATHNGERAGYVLTQAERYAEAWKQAKTAADALAAAMEVL